MRLQKEHTIVHSDGTSHTYTQMQLGALEGRRACARLLKLVGPAIERGAKVKDEGAEVALASALAGLADSMKEEDMEFFCDLMAKQTLVGGQMLTAVFDNHFAGKYQEMVQWLIASLNHNFGSFLSAAGITGPLGELRAKETTESPK